MTRTLSHKIGAAAVALAVAVILLALAAAVRGQEPLDTGGWRASSDAIRLHQYGISPPCPTGSCPTTRGANVWVGAGINRYGGSIVGQRQSQQRSRPYVCQMLRSGFAGSGAYVGQVAGRHVVLSAKHIGAVSSVRFGDGSTSRVTAAFTDRYGYDLAAFVVDSASVAPTILGNVPQQGDVVTIAGWPGGRYGERSGPVAGFLPPQSGQQWGDLDLGFACGGPGDSGGPVLDRSGRLVGIHYGRGPGRALAVSAPAISDFLSRVASQIGESPNGPPPLLPGPGPAETPDDPLVPIEPEQPTPDDRFDAINTRLDELAAAIKAIPAGAKGEQGPQGERGLTGLTGLPGTAPLFDPADLTDDQLTALAERLPPMIFQAKTPDGKLYGEAVPKRLGETVFLKTPKRETTQVQVPNE